MSHCLLTFQSWRQLLETFFIFVEFGYQRLFNRVTLLLQYRIFFKCISNCRLIFLCFTCSLALSEIFGVTCLIKMLYFIHHLFYNLTDLFWSKEKTILMSDNILVTFIRTVNELKYSNHIKSLNNVNEMGKFTFKCF